MGSHTELKLLFRSLEGLYKKATSRHWSLTLIGSVLKKICCPIKQNINYIQYTSNVSVRINTLYKINIRPIYYVITTDAKSISTTSNKNTTFSINTIQLKQIVFITQTSQVLQKILTEQ